MTSSEAQAWRDRWQLVNQREIEELRATSIDTKFRQLAAMMASVDAFAWREELEQGADEVRSRWNRLREAYGV